jgi:hypothetical protein
MWRRVCLLQTDVSVERAASIFRVEEITLARKRLRRLLTDWVQFGYRDGTQSVSNRLTLFLASIISSTLKIEAARSSETSVYNKHALRRISEDGIVLSHRRENLKS